MKLTRNQKRDLLLKMNGLRKSSGLSWPEISDIYEAEAGEKVNPSALRNRVYRVVRRRTDELRDAAVKELDAVPGKPERPCLLLRILDWICGG